MIHLFQVIEIKLLKYIKFWTCLLKSNSPSLNLMDFLGEILHCWSSGKAYILNNRSSLQKYFDIKTLMHFKNNVFFSVWCGFCKNIFYIKYEACDTHTHSAEPSSLIVKHCLYFMKVPKAKHSSMMVCFWFIFLRKEDFLPRSVLIYYIFWHRLIFSKARGSICTREVLLSCYSILDYEPFIIYFNLDFPTWLTY